jgi:hypothetical protein
MNGGEIQEIVSYDKREISITNLFPPFESLHAFPHIQYIIMAYLAFFFPKSPSIIWYTG